MKCKNIPGLIVSLISERISFSFLPVLSPGKRAKNRQILNVSRVASSNIKKEKMSS